MAVCIVDWDVREGGGKGGRKDKGEGEGQEEERKARKDERK